MPIVPEHVWQRRLTDLTLELSPVNASIVCSWLPILFSLQPAFDTVVVNKLHTTSALANLEQWVDLVELTVPTESTLGNVVVVFLNDC